MSVSENLMSYYKIECVFEIIISKLVTNHLSHLGQHKRSCIFQTIIIFRSFVKPKPKLEIYQYLKKRIQK